jgi:HK97 family phage prohead protease
VTAGLELPKRFEVVQWRSAEVIDLDDSTGEVRLRMVPYDREARLGVNLFETFERGAFAGAVKAPSRVKMWNEHLGPLIGRASTVEDLPDGAYATMRFASTLPAQEARTLVIEKIIEECSIEFRAIRESMKARRAPDGIHVSHSRGHLLGAALCAHGVYGDVGSHVLSARSEDADKSHDERLARLRSLSH